MLAPRRDTRLWHPFADMATVRDRELVIDRAEGVWVWDDRGQRYLDAFASLWYVNVGHGRREIADAVHRQLRRLDAYTVFFDYANPPALALAERLAALSTLREARVFLGSGGGDAIETAAKLARRYFVATGRPERSHILTRARAYHGTHGYGTALAGIPANREHWGDLPAAASQVPHDSVDALDREIQAIGAERVAAFFCEPVIGAGGVIPPAPGYIEAVADLCRRHGILFVCDSVICGFGRLGTWFGIERWDVVPDLVVFAKGVTSGYLPLGGVIVDGAIAEPFWSTPGGPSLRHGPTWSGHPACCAAALANLDILEEEGLLRRGRVLERELADALAVLEDRPEVEQVRSGVGAMAAVVLAEPLAGSAVEVALAMRRDGVLVRALDPDTIAVCPPLIIEQEHLDLVTAAFEAALQRASPRRAPAERA